MIGVRDCCLESRSFSLPCHLVKSLPELSKSAMGPLSGCKISIFIFLYLYLVGCFSFEPSSIDRWLLLDVTSELSLDSSDSDGAWLPISAFTSVFLHLSFEFE